MNLTTFATRITPNIDRQEDGCWLWTATINGGGYGTIMVDLVRYVTHRLVYEMFLGPIPDGKNLHHTCQVKACCNPLHLSPVTQAEHRTAHRVLDWDALVVGAPAHRPRGVCHNNHDLTPENSYVRTRADGSFRDRQCRTCRAAVRAKAHATRAC